MEMPNETEQYELVCKAEFGRICRKLDRIDLALRGELAGDDGKPGVLMRLDRLERSDRARAKFGWMVLGSIVALAASAALKLLGA